MDVRRTVAALSLMLSIGTASAQSRPGTSPAVTFNRDIAPLFYAHCVRCHRPDGAAPFSLLTFEDARGRAGLISRVTRDRYMPPWKPEPGFGDFVDSRRLADAQVDLIERWAQQGAQEGDAADRPALPRFPSGWQHGEPDLVVTLPEYELMGEGLDVFRNFVVRIPGTGTRFVRGLEFRPGSQAVHHANIRLDYTSASRALDEQDAGAGYEGLILHSADYPDGHFLLGWTPGQFSPLASKGLAWRLNAGADFVVQLHLRPSGKVERLAPQIGLYFTPDAPNRLPAMLRLGRQNIDIAPGEADYRSSDSYTLPVDVQVQAVQPHSHYRGREVRATAELPDGSTRSIIYIKRWDFAWQDVYRVRQPYWLPAGTRVTTEYMMDNSALNPRNPEQPPARARWGFRSSDEMADVWIQVLTRSDADRVRLVTEFSRKSTAEDVIGYETQLAVSPNNLPLQNDVALLYLELGRPMDAARHFAIVAQQNPQSAVAFFNLGAALEEARALADAASHYERAIVLGPTYVAPRVNLGNVRLRQGRSDEAAAAYEAALALDPDNFGAHNNLGRVMLNDGRASEASTHIEAALRLNPKYPDAHLNMAELLVTRHKLKDAAAHYRDALRLRPEWEPALVGLSWILSSSPDAGLRAPADALRLALEAASVSQRGNPLALDALAAAYARSGQFDEAVSTATDAVSLFGLMQAPELRDAAQARLALYQSHRPYTAADR